MWWQKDYRAEIDGPEGPGLNLKQVHISACLAGPVLDWYIGFRMGNMWVRFFHTVPVGLSKYNYNTISVVIYCNCIVSSNPAIVCIGSVFIAYCIQFIFIINHINQLYYRLQMSLKNSIPCQNYS